MTGVQTCALPIFGAGQWVNGHGWGAYAVLLGFVVWGFTLQQWFRQAIGESEGGLYSDRIDLSFRWSMSWFIFSEVMFFAAFFGALGYARMHSVPDLGSIDAKLLWPDFAATWPTSGPYLKEVFSPMSAWGIPAIKIGRASCRERVYSSV